MRLFLDTTIQCDRYFNCKARKEKIRKNLNQKHLISSRYVLGEYQYTFVSDLVTYYNLLVDSPTPEDALIRSQRYKERIHKRITALFATLVEQFAEKQDILDRLEIWIEGGLIEGFKYGLAEIVDSTACKRAEARPVKKDKIYSFSPGCQKHKPIICQIKNFILNNFAVLKMLHENLDAEHPKQNNFKVALGTIVIQRDKPSGTNCYKVGDIIITLEAPEDSEIYTSNLRDFEPLCNLLGKRLYIETS